MTSTCWVITHSSLTYTVVSTYVGTLHVLHSGTCWRYQVLGWCVCVFGCLDSFSGSPLCTHIYCMASGGMFSQVASECVWGREQG